MTDYTATIPAFVRTPDGIVKVGLGERIPVDALPSEVARLAAAGVAVIEPQQEPAATSAPAPAAADGTSPAAPESSKGRSRGRSGTSHHRSTEEN